MHSATWRGAPPEISVVISTYRRPAFLEELHDALAGQSLAAARFEVVLVDNGSGDGTWATIGALAARSPLRFAGVSLGSNRGPAGGRNAGLGLVRAPLVAMTDDDCLPTPAWLEALLTALQRGADVVQGTVRPDPGSERGMWDRSVEIGGPSVFFETCNIAYRLDRLLAVGAFDEHDAVTARAAGGRAFGEDAVAGARVLAAGGGRGFAPEALLHHRVIPAGFRDALREVRQRRGFPGLVGRSDPVRRAMVAGVFLDGETARFDLAVAGLALAAATRTPALALAVLPWAWRNWGWVHERSRNRADAAWNLARYGVVQAVGLAAMIDGSFRHGRLVL